MMLLSLFELKKDADKNEPLMNKSIISGSFLKTNGSLGQSISSSISSK